MPASTAALDRYEARKRVLADLQEQGFLVGEKDHALSIGKCDVAARSRARLSEQWFIKIQPLAQKAIKAVESGEITIVPENYKQIYLNWMNNISTGASRASCGGAIAFPAGPAPLQTRNRGP